MNRDKKRKMRTCKQCHRPMPFPVEARKGRTTFCKTINFCGYCVNPISDEWIEAYQEWLKTDEAKKYFEEAKRE